MVFECSGRSHDYTLRLKRHLIPKCFFLVPTLLRGNAEQDAPAEDCRSEQGQEVISRGALTFHIEDPFFDLFTTAIVLYLERAPLRKFRLFIL